jgi:HEAT repeat protein
MASLVHHLIGCWTLCGAAFATGYFSAEPPPEAAPIANSLPVAQGAGWRSHLTELRATDRGEALRTQALGILNEAESDVALTRAVELLGWVGDPTDLPMLSAMARSQDPTLGQPAIQAMGRIGGPQATAELLAILHDRDSDSRYLAMQALAHTGEPTALAALIDALDDPLLRNGAAQAVVAFDTPVATRALARHIRTDPMVTQPMLSSLASTRIGRDLVLSLAEGRSGPTRRIARSALVQTHDPAMLPLLLDELENAPMARRWSICDQLGTLGDRSAASALLRAAHTGTSSVRSGALRALARLKASDMLLELVEGTDPVLARDAVSALQNQEEPRVTATLLWAAEQGERELASAAQEKLLQGTWHVDELPREVPALAMRLLAAEGGYTALRFLIRHGADPSTVRSAILQAPRGHRAPLLSQLGAIPTPASAAVLAEFLEDPDPNTRNTAIRTLLGHGGADGHVERAALGLYDGQVAHDYGQLDSLLLEIGTPDATRAVLDRLTEGTTDEALHAASAILNSGRRDAVADVVRIADSLDGPRAEKLMNRLLHANVPVPDSTLDRALSHGGQEVRQAALGHLAHRGRPSDLDRIRSMTSSDDPEARQAAMDALMRTEAPDRTQRLEEGVDDPQTRSSAVQALANDDGEQARQTTQRLARSDDPTLRAEVLQHLRWTNDGSKVALLADGLWDDAPEVVEVALQGILQRGTTGSARLLIERLQEGGLTAGQELRIASKLTEMGGSIADEHGATLADILEASDDQP